MSRENVSGGRSDSKSRVGCNYSAEELKRLKDAHYTELGDLAEEMRRDIGGIFRKFINLKILTTRGCGQKVSENLQSFEFCRIKDLQVAIDKLVSFSSKTPKAVSTDKIDFSNLKVGDEVECKVANLHADHISEGTITASKINCEDWQKYSNYCNADTEVSDINLNNQKGNINMTTRKTVTVELFDDSKGLDAVDSLVFSEKITTDLAEDNMIIQQILLEGEVAAAIEIHNSFRVDMLDESILASSGNEVNLREVKLRDLRWNVKG